jgi:hypothetical protein
VLCKLKCGLEISSNTLCAIKGKKASTHTSHTIQQNFVAKGKGLGLFIARGGSLISVCSMNRDQCSAERHVPRGGGALVPVDATNRDRCSEMNRDRPPGGTNRDQCLSLVPIDKPNRDRCHFGAGPKTHFLLVILGFVWMDCGRARRNSRAEIG